MMQPSTPLERRVAELERELAEAKANIQFVERQDGQMLNDEREQRYAAESKLRQLYERVAAHTNAAQVAEPKRRQGAGGPGGRAGAAAGGAKARRAAGGPSKIPGPRR